MIPLTEAYRMLGADDSSDESFGCGLYQHIVFSRFSGSEREISKRYKQCGYFGTAQNCKVGTFPDSEVVKAFRFQFPHNGKCQTGGSRIALINKNFGIFRLPRIEKECPMEGEKAGMSCRIFRIIAAETIISEFGNLTRSRHALGSAAGGQHTIRIFFGRLKAAASVIYLISLSFQQLADLSDQFQKFILKRIRFCLAAAFMAASVFRIIKFFSVISTIQNNAI